MASARRRGGMAKPMRRGPGRASCGPTRRRWRRSPWCRRRSATGARHEAKLYLAGVVAMPLQHGGLDHGEKHEDMSGPSPDNDEARSFIGSTAELVTYLEQGA